MKRIVTVTLLGLALVGCASSDPVASMVTVTETPPAVTVTAGVVSSQTVARTAALAPTTKATSSAPDGYNSIATGLYGKWGTASPGDCSYYDKCWVMDVFSDTGCPGGIYVEVSIETSDGTAVDWTNGTLSMLRPGGKGRIVFGKMGEGSGTKARFAEASCR